MLAAAGPEDEDLEAAPTPVAFASVALTPLMLAALGVGYSHSIVLGGFDEMS